MNKRKWLQPLPVVLILLTVPVIPIFFMPPGEVRLILAAIATSIWGIWLSIAVHEAGHLLGARMVGFQWLTYVVGPLKIRRTRGGPRVEVNDRWLPLGMAVSLPRDHRNLRRRITVMLAGGPGANLILMLIAGFGAYLLIDSFPSREARREWLLDPAAQLSFMLVLQIAGQSMVQGLFNLIPIKEKGLLSDGARILMLLRGGKIADRWCALWATYAGSAAGRRPRDWDPALMQQATSVPDGSVDDAGSSMLAYAWALDRGDLEAAGEFLVRAREAVVKVPILGPPTAAEAAFFAARYRGDVAAARALLTDAHGGILEEHARLRAEAATLLAEGDAAGAQERARRALHDLENASSTTPGSAEAYADWLNEIIREAQGTAREPVRAG